MFEKIKGYYNDGLWSLERVRNVVGLAISEAEFEAITGAVFGEGI